MYLRSISVHNTQRLSFMLDCSSRISSLLLYYHVSFLTIITRWFSVNMGTGIVSILLHNLPYNGVWLYWISVIIFALNVVLFVLFLFTSLLRYTLYPRIWTAMLNHPTQSLFLGTFPMGLATIINMVVFVCVPAWGPRTVNLVGI